MNDQEVKIVELPPLLARTSRVAELLDTAPQTLENWRAQGRGPPYHCIAGLGVRYRLDEVARWVAENPPGGRCTSYSRKKAAGSAQ